MAEAECNFLVWGRLLDTGSRTSKTTASILSCQCFLGILPSIWHSHWRLGDLGEKNVIILAYCSGKLIQVADLQ